MINVKSLARMMVLLCATGVVVATTGKTSVSAAPTETTLAFPVIESFSKSKPDNDIWVAGADAKLPGGYLKLTADGETARGSMVAKDDFSSKLGVLVEFDYAMWGGKTFNEGGIDSYGDGFSMFLVDGKAVVSTGAPGGSLGYSCAGDHKVCSGTPGGVYGGYVGVGFDVYGNFSGDRAGNGAAPGRQHNSIAVRGAGDNNTGFPHLTVQTVDEKLLRTPDDKTWNTAHVSIINQHLDLSITSGGKATQVLKGVDLSKAGALPDTLKIGFAAGTGKATENHAIRNLKIALPVDLTIDNSHDSTGVPGSQVRYVITAGNKGPNNAKESLIEDAIPAEVENVTYTCASSKPGGTCGAGSSGSGNKIKANVDLDKDGEVKIEVTGTLKSSLAKDFKVSATAMITPKTESDLHPDDNTDTSEFQIADPQAQLATAKKALNPKPVVPGEKFEYEVTVTNNGPSDATKVKFVDNLPVPLSFVSGDKCSAAGQVVTCIADQPLAPKHSQTWKFTVKLSDTYTGDGSDLGNVAVAQSDTKDPSPSPTSSVAFPSGVASPYANLVTTKKALNPKPVVPGETFDYEITVTNNGPSQAKDVGFSDHLPAPLSYVGTSGPKHCQSSSGEVTCDREPTLAVGKSVSWRFTVKLDSAYTGNGSDLGNVAVVQSHTGHSSQSPSPVYPSGSPFGVASAVADLAMAKKALNTKPVVSGETFDYLMTVSNNGPSDAKDVKFTDNLPSALAFVKGDKCSAAGQLVTCTADAPLAAKQSVSWTMTVRLDSAYTGDGTDLGNVAVASSKTIDPNPTNNSNSPAAFPSASGGQIVASPSADLWMAKKALNAKPVVPGTNFDYQITITNNGPSDARKVVATDSLPAALSFVSGADCKFGQGKVSCGPEAVLKANTAKSWTFTVKLSEKYTGDGSDIGNIAVAKADTPDPNPFNNSNSPAAPSGVASAQALLSTTKKAMNTKPVVPGETFDYQITIKNNGPSQAQNVSAADTLPLHLTFVSSTACHAVTQSQHDVVTCDPQATLGVGKSAVWTFTVKLDSGYTGDGSDLGNVAVAHSDTIDPSPTKSPTPVFPSGSPHGVASPSADLWMAKKALNTKPVIPGTTFDYQITITNNGPSMARNVTAADKLPLMLTFVSSGLDHCTSTDKRNVSCGPIATLDAKKSQSWVFTVMLDGAYTGNGSDLGNFAVAKADTPDPDLINNSNSPAAFPAGGKSAVASPLADLTLAKRALNTEPVVTGETFDYLVTVKNNGPSDAKDVKFTDTLPKALTMAPTQKGGCTTQSNKHVVVCPAVPSLKAGASTSWTFTVVLDSGYSGDGSDLGNIAVATSDTKDPSPLNNSNSPAASPGSIGLGQADLATTKRALNPKPVVPGETFEYEVTITNNGPSASVNVRLIDDLPLPLTFVSADPKYGCSAGNPNLVACLPLKPSLLAGESSTWVFTVRLDDGYTGNGSDLGNVAVSNSDTHDPSPSNDANTPPAFPSRGVASAEADLSLDKQAMNTTPVVPGETFDYEVTITNHGPSAARNVRFTDTLPGPLTFISSVGNECTGLGAQVICQPVTALAAGDHKTWRFTVALDSGYTGDGSDLGNVAVSKSDTHDPSPSNSANPHPASPSGGVASAQAHLTITKKALDTKPIRSGEMFEYEVIVKNTGPSTARNVGFLDTLPMNLIFVSSSSGCTVSGTPARNIDCPKEPWVAVGEFVVWRFKVQLDPGYTGDGSDLGNVAVTHADTHDPTPSASSGKVFPSHGIASAAARLTTVKKALDTKPVSSGETFSYEITISNQGPSVARNVGPVDMLPKPLAFVSSADCSADKQKVTCTPLAVMPVGGSRTWTFVVKLDPGYTGDGSDLGNVAVSRSDTPDPTPSYSQSPVPVFPSHGVASPLADVAMAKVALNTKPVVPGETFSYRLTITNYGPANAPKVTATDVLPLALTFVSGDADCSTSANGQTVTCGPLTQPLPAGQSKSWTFVVRLDPRYSGDGSDLGNVAVAQSKAIDPTPGNNSNSPAAFPSGSGHGVASASADLVMAKAALNTEPLTPGDAFAYMVTVTNRGVSAARVVRVTDRLPMPLVFKSSPDGCTVAGQVVSCSSPNLLDPGKSISWRFTVELDSKYTGDGSDLGNIAVVSSATLDPSPFNNSNPPVTPSGGVIVPPQATPPGGGYDHVRPSIRVRTSTNG